MKVLFFVICFVVKGFFFVLCSLLKILLFVMFGKYLFYFETFYSLFFVPFWRLRSALETLFFVLSFVFVLFLEILLFVLCFVLKALFPVLCSLFCLLEILSFVRCSVLKTVLSIFCSLFYFEDSVLCFVFFVLFWRLYFVYFNGYPSLYCTEDFAILASYIDFVSRLILIVAINSPCPRTTITSGHLDTETQVRPHRRYQR